MGLQIQQFRWYNACNEALVGRNGFKIIEESEIKKMLGKAEEIVRGGC